MSEKKDSKEIVVVPAILVGVEGCACVSLFGTDFTSVLSATVESSDFTWGATTIEANTSDYILLTSTVTPNAPGEKGASLGDLTITITFPMYTHVSRLEDVVYYEPGGTGD